MRQLILMRHAEAAHAGIGQSDFDRPLTDRGVQGALGQARLLLENKLLPDKILCSSALRTKTTWDVMRGPLADALPFDFETCLERGLYNASHLEIIKAIRETSDNVDNLLVIAHNPGIYEAALMLAEPAEGQSASHITMRLQEGYPPAAMTVFALNGRNWLETSNAQMTVQNFWPPRGG